MTDTPQPDDYWEDREAARKLQGIYANRIYVQNIGNGMLRVNFGQVFDEEPSYHSAVVLSAEDAVAFGELIARNGRALLPPPLTGLGLPPLVDAGGHGKR